MRSQLRKAVPLLALGLVVAASARCAGRADESFIDDPSAGADAGRGDGGRHHRDGGGRPDAGADGGSDAGTDGGPDGGTSQRARIRFCNLYSASTGTPLQPFAPYSFDVYVQGQATPLLAGLAYGGPASLSPEQEVAAQPTVFEVRKAGDSPAAAPLFRSAPVAIGADARLTAFLVAGSGSAPSLDLKVLEDGFATPAAGTVRVRFFNYALLPSPLRIYGTDPATPLATVPSKDSSAPEGIELPADPAISLTLRGSSFPGGRTTFTLPSDLAAGSQILVALEGNPNGTAPSDPQALKLLFWSAAGAARASAQDPVLYFIDATPGSPPLGLGLQGRSLLGTTTLTFPATLGFALKPVQLPPSATGYTLDVSDASGPDPVPIAPVATGPLASGERYLGVLTLSGATTTAADLKVYRSGFPSRAVAGRIDGRVRVLDVVTSPGALDLGTFDAADAFNPLLSNLNAGFASAEPGEPISPDRWVDATAYRVRYGYRSAGAAAANEAIGLPLSAPPNSARFFLLAGNDDSIDPSDRFRFIIVSTESATWGGQVASSFVRR